MENQGSCEPERVQTLQALSESLRVLKKRSGLSFRQLEERAAAAGEVLPRSSLSCVLNRGVVPRPDLLIAFVRACGEEDRVTEWVEARARALAGQPPVPSPATAPGMTSDSAGPPPGPFEPERGLVRARGPRRWHRRRAWVVSAALLAMAVAVGFTVLRDSREQQVRADSPPGTVGSLGSGHLPPSGWVTIRVASDPELCLSDGRVRDWRYTPLVAVQRPCAATAPQSTLLEPVSEGRYRIQWHHPDYGKGCLKVLTVGSGEGLLEPMDDCAAGSLFSIEPSGALAHGRFVLRVEGEGCVGIVRSSAIAGAEAVMQRCTGKGRQVFLVRALDRGEGAGRSGSSTVPSTRATGK